MSGVIGIYGLIVAVILLNGIKTPKEGYAMTKMDLNI